MSAGLYTLNEARVFAAAPTIPPPFEGRICLIASAILLAAVALFLACC